MTTAKPPARYSATGARGRAAFALPSYTTTGDATRGGAKVGSVDLPAPQGACAFRSGPPQSRPGGLGCRRREGSAQRPNCRKGDVPVMV